MEKETSKLSTPMAIIIVGILIAGAVYFSSTGEKNVIKDSNDTQAITLAPISAKDTTLGNPNAEISLVLYEDFQCPFCGAVAGYNEPLIQALKQRDANWVPFMPEILENYVKSGKVQFVYRDWAFLGPESIKAAEAARCAGDQDKFWEYHDYLYSHQDGENKGTFSDINLKSFAKTLGLDSSVFDKCLDENKYTQAVLDSRKEGTDAGVSGTPKGFILKNGKVVNTINGAESLDIVKQKIDSALK